MDVVHLLPCQAVQKDVTGQYSKVSPKQNNHCVCGSNQKSTPMSSQSFYWVTRSTNRNAEEFKTMGYKTYTERDGGKEGNTYVPNIRLSISNLIPI